MLCKQVVIYHLQHQLKQLHHLHHLNQVKQHQEKENAKQVLSLKRFILMPFEVQGEINAEDNFRREQGKK